MKKCVRTDELFTCEVEYLKDMFAAYDYPWQMLPKIKEQILKLLQTGIEGFTEPVPGILVGENVKLAKNTTIEAPAIIGHNTEIRPGAYIRGNVITGSNCVIGNATELKNSILLNDVQVPHYNYVGDSILGNHAHMGAGAVCSNLKSDGKMVVIHGDTEMDTRIRKVGGILADGADVGCGCVINPGTIIGKNTSIYPLTALRGVIPSNCIVKSSDHIVRRMKW